MLEEAVVVSLFLPMAHPLSDLKCVTVTLSSQQFRSILSLFIQAPTDPNHHNAVSANPFLVLHSP